MFANRITIIQTVCKELSKKDSAAAKRIIEREYPFSPAISTRRSYTPRQMTKIFRRDGFIDRYRGTQLVYPPVLRIISHYLPREFPYHKNWKLDKTHMAYWEHCPTIDHIMPLARGGTDEEDNLVCCSMLTNSIKANWTLEELQWQLLPSGDQNIWDGMFNWFIDLINQDHKHLIIPYIRKWYDAAKEIANCKE